MTLIALARKKIGAAFDGGRITSDAALASKQPLMARTRRTSLKPALILVAFSVGGLLQHRRPRLARNGPRWSVLELLGAGFLVVVVFAHIAEAFGLFSLMGGAGPAAHGTISTS
jgi:hypothetical protein